MKVKKTYALKRIKELNRQFRRLIVLISKSYDYEIQSYKKKDVMKLTVKKIVHTINGQGSFLKQQKKALVKERWSHRRLIIELRNLYKDIIDKQDGFKKKRTIKRFSKKCVKKKKKRMKN